MYPKEIEDLLNKISGVHESAVFGVPHDDFGEQVVAAIVPDSGMKIEISSLRSIVEAKLARFKHPREYVVMSKLPRNMMGKVTKNILRNKYK